MRNKHYFSLLAVGKQSASRIPSCLRRGINASTCADNGNAVKLLGSESYDILMCDLRRPDMDAIALVKEVRRISPQTAVVFSIDKQDLRFALLAIIGGAAGFVVHADSAKHFFRRITALRARWAVMSLIEKAVGDVPHWNASYTAPGRTLVR